jgi:hypothetical protein
MIALDKHEMVIDREAYENLLKAEQLLKQAHPILQGFNQVIDQMLPQAGKLVIDVGLLNDTLIRASAFMREYAKTGEPL